MKKLLLLIASACFTIGGVAQVNYESTYLLTPSQEWFLTDLGNSDYKYVIYAYDSSRFSLYNLDHSPFILDIQIPFAVVDTPTNTYYRLGYITRSLFDCDSTTIEYAIMLDIPKATLHPNFAIYRTDGTLIFSKDTVGTMFCVGCGSGSWEVHPIMNTSAGAKLYLFNYDSVGYYQRTFVYGLCGTLPEMVTELGQSSFYVKVYPNPSSSMIHFELTLPSSYEEYELIVFNAHFQTIKTSAVRGIKTRIDLDNESLSSGTYFYSLQNKHKVFQTGKFIISK